MILSNDLSHDPHPRRRIAVLDSEVSYVDTGEGLPIVFLHGNPTSSYLWRNIIPYVAGLGRCLAPDLVGMGQSGKSPARSYRFVDHRRYLDAWFDVLRLHSQVILVVHDWGSALGFDRARRFPTHFVGVAYMEAIALPHRWEDFGEAGGIFRALRSPQGEGLVLGQNAFIERVLPAGVLRTPFPNSDDRLPTLTWPRQIPIEGEPGDVQAIVENYGQWLTRSNLPKLAVFGDPGAIVSGRTKEFCKIWPNQTEITVKGRHFLQEDAPDEIGKAVAGFVERVRAAGAPA
jgi:haloalkane dehalogenase